MTTTTLSLAVNGYLNELDKVSASRIEYLHLKNSEKLYWVIKYSSIVSHLIKALGEDYVKTELGDRNFSSLEVLFFNFDKDPDY